MGPGLRPGAVQARSLASPGGTWSPSADGETLFDFPVPRKGPYGIRKYPCGVFSRKAVADLLGQAMNGERIAHPLLREKRFRRFS